MDPPPELEPTSIREWCNREYVGRSEEGLIVAYRKDVLDWMIENFPKEEITSILDVGTGEGVFLNRFSELTGAKDCLGIDISDVQIDRCKKRWADKNYKFERSDFLDVHLDQKYDLAICWSVLLHIPPHQVKQFTEKLIASAAKYIILLHGRPDRPDVPDRMEWYHDHNALFGQLEIHAQQDSEPGGPRLVLRIYKIPKEEPEPIEEKREEALT